MNKVNRLRESLTTKVLVPVWVLGMLLLTVGALVGSLVAVTLSSAVVQVPIEVTATSVPAAATLILATVTPIQATASPVACPGGNGIAGVDCPLIIGGMPVTVIGQERTSVFTVTVKLEGKSVELPYEPEDPANEFLVIHLALPQGTTIADFDVWFEDGGTHAPRLEGTKGEKYNFKFVYLEEDPEVLVIAFLVPKTEKDLSFRIQNESVVQLARVPVITAASAGETGTANVTSLAIVPPGKYEPK